MNLEYAFETFFQAISLGTLPNQRVESAWNRLQGFLGEKLDLEESRVFIQGSFANDTAVQPPTPTGEYDLDIVAVCATGDQSADEAFQQLEAVLRTDADYAKRIETGERPCVRLHYADDPVGGFHIDVVAARPCGDHLEIPLRANTWKETHPRGFTAWCRGQGEQFLRTVRMLKRWRDENEGERRCVKSIVLQVLVASALPSTDDDATAVQGALQGILEQWTPYTGQVPRIPNPVLAAEDLAERWPLDHCRAFKDHIAEAAELAARALASTDVRESHHLWRQLLGPGFPAPPSTPAESGPPPPAPPRGFETAPQPPPRRERWG